MNLFPIDISADYPQQQQYPYAEDPNDSNVSQSVKANSVSHQTQSQTDKIIESPIDGLELFYLNKARENQIALASISPETKWYFKELTAFPKKTGGFDEDIFKKVYEKASQTEKEILKQAGFGPKVEFSSAYIEVKVKALDQAFKQYYLGGDALNPLGYADKPETVLRLLITKEFFQALAWFLDQKNITKINLDYSSSGSGIYGLFNVLESNKTVKQLDLGFGFTGIEPDEDGRQCGEMLKKIRHWKS